MERYKHPGSDSGLDGYEITADSSMVISTSGSKLMAKFG